MALIYAGELTTATSIEDEGENQKQPAYLHDFYIDHYEVTNQQYLECMSDGYCEAPLNTKWINNPAYLDHPIVYVNYTAAQTYCEWRGARLPSQAEWEFAASEELESLNYFWGDKSPICQIGSRLGEKIEIDSEVDIGTNPVGSLDPNAFGLYDMTGSLWEWVQDMHDGRPDDSSQSVVSFLRMSSWIGYGPVYSRFLCGFRCARSP